eukprot:TRINITY_DN57676_c0_g1_i1.p1 TRINITY_DN57676_c0_g1~~TRINITY_DN57676_c0_g1_i1.p1  ORF type:complete len:277 (+),score=40.55 TRINITY_DN57676_c0_g1_i1:240-1070(+)
MLLGVRRRGKATASNGKVCKPRSTGCRQPLSVSQGTKPRQTLLAVARRCRDCGLHLNAMEGALHQCSVALEWRFSGEVVANGWHGAAESSPEVCRVLRLDQNLAPAAREQLEAVWDFIRKELPHSLGGPPVLASRCGAGEPPILLMGLRGRIVVGLLWAERVAAHRVFEVADVSDCGKSHGSGCVSTTASHGDQHKQVAVLGVALIWVRRGEQRRGLATALVNAARRQPATFGCQDVALEEVAFSQPTDQGFEFASRYLHCARKGKVLIYEPPWQD